MLLLKMGSEAEACAECTSNCLTIHRKCDPSLIVTSFFKVMYGKQFSEVVIVPPRFAKLASLATQKTYIEDSNGRKWDVFVSNINGSLALQKGWSAFSQDHDIELGDFVVFHYIMGSHFIVRIYGKSGCERLSFSGEKRNQNKRAKTIEYSRPEIGLSDSICKESSINEEGVNYRTKTTKQLVATTRPYSSSCKEPSPKEGVNGCSVSRSSYRDGGSSVESYFMTNIGKSSAAEVDRSHLLDLSSYEMLHTKVDDDKTSKVQIIGNGYPKNDVKSQFYEGNIVGSSSECKVGLLQGNGYSRDDAMKLRFGKGNTAASECIVDVHKTINVPLQNDAQRPQLSERNIIASSSEFKMDASKISKVQLLGNGWSQVDASKTIKVPLQNDAKRPQLSERNTSASSSEFKMDASKISEVQLLGNGWSQVDAKKRQFSEGSAVASASGRARINQEPRKFNQVFHGNPVAGATFNVSGHDDNLSISKVEKCNDYGLGEASLHTVKDRGGIDRIKKPETVQFSNSPSTLVRITCLVKPDSECFLELPQRLPVKACRQGANLEQKLVFLRDPGRRLWPVIYHQQNNLPVLASGWKAFRKANNIQPGNECTFVVENVYESIYRVEIRRS